MQYKIIVFITEEYLKALDVTEEERFSDISIEGNKRMRYLREEDADRFCDYIRMFYNINQFSELDIFALIVDATKTEEKRRGAEYIFDALCGCKRSLLAAEQILPILVNMKEMLGASQEIRVCFLGGHYLVQADEEFRISVRAEEGEAELVLDESAAAGIYYFKGTDSLSRALRPELEEKEERIKALEGRLEEAKREAADLWLRLKGAEKEGKELQEEMERLRLEHKKCKENMRIICYADKRSFEGNFDMYCYQKFVVRFEIANGELVTPRQHIATIRPSYYFQGFKAYSPIRGRFFHLVEEEKEIESGLGIWGGVRMPGTAVAIIGAEDDTEEEVMEWYAKISENKEKTK
ncbi:MAG: hypothetical protein Q4A19_08965 [Johnsonella sp.]|nr:hypothetical protein [Johnsonella sp.]